MSKLYENSVAWRKGNKAFGERDDEYIRIISYDQNEDYPYRVETIAVDGSLIELHLTKEMIDEFEIVDHAATWQLKDKFKFNVLDHIIYDVSLGEKKAGYCKTVPSADGTVVSFDVELLTQGIIIDRIWEKEHTFIYDIKLIHSNGKVCTRHFSAYEIDKAYRLIKKEEIK